MCHYTIHNISDESYIEALSHIDIEKYYFCVIKYDLFVDINVYNEVFSAHKYELEIIIDAKIIIFNNKLNIPLENMKLRTLIKDT